MSSIAMVHAWHDDPHVWSHEDANGNETRWWRQFRRCSDGTVVIGLSSYHRQDCIDDAQAKVDRREAYLMLLPRERLRVLVNGELHDTDHREATRLLAELVLELTQEK